MTSKFINLTICISLIQFISSCAAPLSEQCRQLKVTMNMTTESYYAHEKETDPKKKSELLSQSFRETTKALKSLSLSDSYLRGIQEKLIKNKEGLAERDNYVGLDRERQDKSFAEFVRLAKENGTISDDLKNYCQS